MIASDQAREAIFPSRYWRSGYMIKLQV